MNTASAPGHVPLADGGIELTLPLAHQHAATARVVAASLAAAAGLDVEAIDDLRLGVDEAVAVVVESASAPTGAPPEGARLLVRFEPAPDAITVRVGRSGEAPAIAVADIDDLATRILRVVVDRFDVEGGMIVLVKRTVARDGG